MSSPTPHLHAVLWVLLSTLIWTVIFAAGKLTSGALGVFQLTLLRYLGALPVIALLVLRHGGLRQHRSQRPLSHLARAVCGCGAAVAITWASTRMPLIDATAIGILSGVIATLLGAVVLRETMRGNQIAAVALSLLGVGIVVIGKGAFQTGLVILPALIALSSALLMATEGLLISTLGRQETARTVMLYVTCFGVCLMLVPATLQWQQVTAKDLGFALALGPLSVLGQYCTIRGYRMAPLSVVAPLDYTWLIFAALLGLVAFNEHPSASTWAGCAAIALGGWMLTRTRAAPSS
jgi:drug/metabolite transporter (DMT)-like permease